MKSEQEIINRAAMINMLREEEWLSETMEYLWDNPHEFEQEGSIFHAPDIDVSDEDAVLFKFAFLAGIEYERTYPTGDDNYEV